MNTTTATLSPAQTAWSDVNPGDVITFQQPVRGRIAKTVTRYMRVTRVYVHTDAHAVEHGIVAVTGTYLTKAGKEHGTLNKGYIGEAGATVHAAWLTAVAHPVAETPAPRLEDVKEDDIITVRAFSARSEKYVTRLVRVHSCYVWNGKLMVTGAYANKDGSRSKVQPRYGNMPIVEAGDLVAVNA